MTKENIVIHQGGQ